MTFRSLIRRCRLALAGAGCAVLCGCGGQDGRDAFTGLISRELRQLEEEESRIGEELKTLPDLALGRQGERLGWHGRVIAGPRNPGTVARPADNAARPAQARAARTLRLDLGALERIDQIVLVPAELSSGNDPTADAGYGFPSRFRVETSEDPVFNEPVLVADHSGVPFPNPGKFPVIFARPDLNARYVRITVLDPSIGPGQPPLALGEIMVLQGNRNLAGGLPRSAIELFPRQDTDNNPPQWSVDGLTDGLSILGTPTAEEATGSEGYQSEPVKRADTRKWVQVDLGEERSIDEIRLVPASSGYYRQRRGYGFPHRWKVETSLGSGFEDPQTVAEFTLEDFPNPDKSTVVINARGHRARFVRFTATRLSSRVNDFVLALAEMQVFSGDENIARGAPAQASDQEDSGIWQLKYLTDGLSSTHRLTDWPQYLQLINRRQQLEERLAEIARRRPQVSTAVLWKVLYWAMGLLVLAAIATFYGIVRQRRLRLRELALLRQRISQDVHDEIGAGLGTIKLLSQMGAADEERDETTRADFAEIAGITRDIGESLRDIVWLIRPDNRTAGDLARRLKDTATTMLSSLKHEFTADMDDLAHDLPLEFKRQVILFFKEALHNLLKHSCATRARVHIDGDSRYFLLTVEDDGKGFDASELSSGAGLSGMRQRAETLKGSLKIDTSPGCGTRLLLEVPWP